MSENLADVAELWDIDAEREAELEAEYEAMQDRLQAEHERMLDEQDRAREWWGADGPYWRGAPPRGATLEELEDGGWFED